MFSLSASDEPPAIRAWIEGQFSDDRRKTFFEAGANEGQDTLWLAAIPGVTLHCWEPDQRVQPSWPLPGNVIWNTKALAATRGRAPFILCDDPLQANLYSSLKRPTAKLKVRFGPWIEVQTTTLDFYAETRRIKHVDLLWADTQGGEPDMIRGGQTLLAKTDWLYCECPAVRQYKGQLGVEGLLELLPGRWRMVHRWRDDVLFERLIP